MNKLSSDLFTLLLIREDLIQLQIKEGVEIGESEVRKIAEGYEKLTKNKPYAVIVNAKAFSSVTKKAREVSANELYSPNRVGSAIMVENLGQQLLASFYINVNKPKVPTRIFQNREKAIEWLEVKLEEYKIKKLIVP